MVDAGRLRTLLDRIADETAHLRRLAAMPDDELTGDPDRLAAVKYRFVVAIEAAIDVCQHVISSEGLRAPADFADAFRSLGEAGYLQPEIVPQLQQMTRFRNLLVHGYARIDDARVVDVLRTRLDDLDSFRRQVAQQVV